MYAAHPTEWTEPQISSGVVLSDIAASYILNASELARAQRTAEQLQRALDSRVIIEQAKGKVAGELAVSPEEAFRLIRHHARSTHATLRATCHAVLEEGSRAIRPAWDVSERPGS